MTDTAGNPVDAGNVDANVVDGQKPDANSKPDTNQPQPSDKVDRAELQRVIRDRDQVKKAMNDLKGSLDSIREAFGGDLPTAEFLEEARAAQKAAETAETEKAIARGEFEKLYNEQNKTHAEQIRIEKEKFDQMERAFRTAQLENKAAEILAPLDLLPQAALQAKNALVRDGVDGKRLDIRFNEATQRYDTIIFDDRLGAPALDDKTGEDLSDGQFGELFKTDSPFFFRSPVPSGAGTNGPGMSQGNNPRDAEAVRTQALRGEYDPAAWAEYKKMHGASTNIK